MPKTQKNLESPEDKAMDAAAILDLVMVEAPDEVFESGTSEGRCVCGRILGG